MITTFLLRLAAGLVAGLFSLVPSFGADPAGPASSFASSFASSAGSLNGYVPEATALVCLGVLLAIRFGLLAWKGLLFVYSILPFKAT